MDEFDLHKEPEYHFIPLTQEKYCHFYDIEMCQFDDDLPFYLSSSRPGDITLELGCGSGRLTRKLDQSGRLMTGIDNSFAMLRKAKSFDTPKINYICGDLVNFAVKKQFDTIIIPYNTLNLLSSFKQVTECLTVCQELLTRRGRLLLHLFVPNEEMVPSKDKRTFQFQIFPLSPAMKLIKETFKLYQQSQEKLVIEERYRIRTNRSKTMIKEDYNHSMELLAFPSDTWLRAIDISGFTLEKQYGGYQLLPYIPGQGSCLLIVAKKA